LPFNESLGLASLGLASLGLASPAFLNFAEVGISQSSTTVKRSALSKQPTTCAMVSSWPLIGYLALRSEPD
jgi:hypothetical protein